MKLLLPDLHLLALTLKYREGPLGNGIYARTGVEVKPERIASNRLDFYPCTCICAVIQWSFPVFGGEHGRLGAGHAALLEPRCECMWGSQIRLSLFHVGTP
jgi:hypothetical protein